MSALRWSIALSVLLSIGGSCAALVPNVASPSATPRRNEATPSGTAPPLTFSVDGVQARYVATVVAFVDAFNRGDSAEAVSLFGEHSGVSDCDYRNVKAVSLDGRSAVEGWLRERAIDHDRLVISRIFNANPDGDHVVGVVYARRTSDTLAALGFPSGIVPLTSKVVFSADGGQILAFANGPFGGPSEACRPRS